MNHTWLSGSTLRKAETAGALRQRWWLVVGAGLTMAVIFGTANTAPANAQPNPIEVENARSGTADWELSNPATNREIEGYASLASVDQGETVDLFVNTAAPTFSLEVFRTGWYDGDGARRVLGPLQVAGTDQGPAPSPDATTGIVEANWTNPYTLSIGSDWTTGVYLARLTESAGGNQSYIIFVVRDDGRSADLLLQLPIATYQAYNFWGGKSAYDFGSCNPNDPVDPVPCTFPWGTDLGSHADKVSFDRPFAASTNGAAARGMGAGEYLTNVQPVAEFYPISSDGWDYNTVRFLEREGYDVTYSTDLDTHVASVGDLTRHEAILSVGHDEYWSWEMRDHVEAAIAAGTDVAFMGANIAYWQIRFEANTVTGTPMRTMVIYKEYEDDPYYLDGDPSNNYLISTLFREYLVDRPEEAMIGIRYRTDPFNHDITVADASHWAFAGTGLSNGDKLEGLLGYEIDTLEAESPSNINVLGASLVQKIGDTPVDPYYTAHMTMYEAPSGAFVFAIGSMQWSWGLDDYNAPDLRPSVLSPAAQRITRNVLDRFIDSSGPPLPSAADDGPYSVGKSGSVTVVAPGVLDNDTDPAGGGLAAELRSDPSHGTVSLDEDGSFTYTHDGSEATSDSFTYRVQDADDAYSNTATVSVVVTPGNDAPVAKDDGPYLVANGGSKVVAAPGVLGNDTDADDTVLTAVKTSDPSHGTVTLNSNGSFTYTHGGDSATSDSFTYKAKDDGGALSNSATVSIVIGDSLPDVHSTGLVDPGSGKWYLYDDAGMLVTSFFYGNPGDYPFMGDWDGDGVETPGLYRQSDGYVYLRNSNTVGIADIKFFFGNPGDVPIAGDFNNDGFDTVSIYRPSNQTFYIINKLGSGDAGLGAADFSYVFGNPGDKPFVGDFDGDGIETAGLHRESTGLVYFRNTHTQGNADAQFIYGDPGDRLIAGDWTGDGTFTPALFRPSNTTMYFRYTNTQGNADNQFVPSPTNQAWLPVSGKTN